MHYWQISTQYFKGWRSALRDQKRLNMIENEVVYPASLEDRNILKL